MKKSDVKNIVESNIETIKKQLGLDSWHIYVDYGPALIDGDDTNYSGKCNTDPTIFETALVTIDPKLHDNEAGVLITLRHELAHCIAASFNVCQEVLAALLTKREYKAMDVLFHIAHEAVVRSIQHILDSQTSAEIRDIVELAFDIHTRDPLYVYQKWGIARRVDAEELLVDKIENLRRVAGEL